MAVLMLSCGCSESIREYSRFGGWSGSPNKPIVFSGRPERDSSAYGASDTVLSEHDWQMLEKLAPRPVWERIARLKEQFTGRAEPQRSLPAHG